MATPGPAQAAEGALLAGLRAVLAGRTLVRPAFAAAPADLLRLAAAQNLIPWLEVAYRPGELPTSIAADVQRECLRRRARQALLLGAFEELEQTLGAAGVRAMPFKGLAMAHRHYASPTLRYFDDLDILIPAASADAALAVLAEAGYAPHPRNPRPDWHHLPPQVHRGHHAMVELHLDPARRFKPGWDVAGVWSRASRARLGAVETWLMSDADALVTVALHARHNLFDRLTYFLDAAVLLTALRKRPKELARARELAAEAGVAAALDHLLARTHALFPEAAPGISAETAGRRRRFHVLAGRAGMWPPRLPPGPLRRLAELLLMDRPVDSARLAWRLALPPTDFMRRSAGPGQPVALDYGRRLGRRLLQAGAHGLRLARRPPK